MNVTLIYEDAVLDFVSQYPFRVKHSKITVYGKTLHDLPDAFYNAQNSSLSRPSDVLIIFRKNKTVKEVKMYYKEDGIIANGGFHLAYLWEPSYLDLHLGQGVERKASFYPSTKNELIKNMYQAWDLDKWRCGQKLLSIYNNGICIEITEI